MTVIIIIIVIAIIIPIFILKRKKKKRFIPDKMMLVICTGAFKENIFKTYPGFLDSPDLIRKICNEMIMFFHEEKQFKKDYKFYKHCKSEDEIVLNYFYVAFLEALKEAHSYKYEYKKQPRILLDWTINELKEIGYTFVPKNKITTR